MAPTRSRRIAARKTRSRASTPDPEVDTNEDSSSSEPPQPPQPSRRSARRTRSTTPTAATTSARRQRRNAAVSEDADKEDSKTSDTKAEDTDVGKIATRKSRRKAPEEEKDDAGKKKTPVRRSRRAASAKDSSKGGKESKSQQQKSGILDYFRRKDDKDDDSDSQGSEESEESQETGDKQEDTGDSDGEQNKKSRTPLHEEDEDNESDLSGSTKSSSEAEATDDNSVKKDSSKEDDNNDESDIEQDEADETDESEVTKKPQHERSSDKIDGDTDDAKEKEEEKNSRTEPVSSENESSSVSITQNAALTRGAVLKKGRQKQTMLEEDKKPNKERKETSHEPELKIGESQDEKRENVKPEELSRQAGKRCPLSPQNHKTPDSITKDKESDPSSEKSKAETDKVISTPKDKQRQRSNSPATPKNIFFGGSSITTETSGMNFMQEGPTTHETNAVKTTSPKPQDLPLETSKFSDIASKDEASKKALPSSSQAGDEEKNFVSLSESKGNLKQASPPKSTIQGQGSNALVNAKTPKSLDYQSAKKDKQPEILAEQTNAKSNQVIGSNSKIQGQPCFAQASTIISTNVVSQGKGKDPDQLTDVPALTKIRKPSSESQIDEKEKSPDSPLQNRKAETNRIISTVDDKDPASLPEKNKAETDQYISTTKDKRTEPPEGKKSEFEIDQIIPSDMPLELKGKSPDLPPSSKKDGDASSEVKQQDSTIGITKNEAMSKVIDKMANSSQNIPEGLISDDVRRTAEALGKGNGENNNKSPIGIESLHASEAEHVKIRKNEIDEGESLKLKSTSSESNSKQSNEDDTSSKLTLEKKESESSVIGNEVTKADSTESRLNSEQRYQLDDEQKKLISSEEKSDNPDDVILNDSKGSSAEEKPSLDNEIRSESSIEQTDSNKITSGNTDQKQPFQNNTITSKSSDITTSEKTFASQERITSDSLKIPPEIDASASTPLEPKSKSSKLDGELSNEGDREPEVGHRQESFSSLQAGDVKSETTFTNVEINDELVESEIKHGEEREESRLGKGVQVKEAVDDSEVKGEVSSTADEEADSNAKAGEPTMDDAKREKRPISELSRHEVNEGTPGLVDDAADGALEQKLRDTEALIQKRAKVSTLDHGSQLSVEKEETPHKLLGNGMKNANSDSVDSMKECSSIVTTSTVQNTHVQSNLSEGPNQLKQESMPDIRRPKVSIDQIKIRIYTVGYKTHHGKGAEKLFANYWDALSNFLGVSTNNNSAEKRYYMLNGTRKAINKFLTTKKLRRLHNMLILGLLNHADCTTALADDVLAHIPPRWRKRVKPMERKMLKPSEAHIVPNNDFVFETSIQSDYNSHSATWTASGVPESYSTISDNTKLSICLDETAPLDHKSSPLPGALSMDPIIRSMAEKEGLKVSENAVWLIMVGMREYVKSLMKNTISCMNSINDANELPEASELIQAIGPVSKDRVSTFKDGIFSQPSRTTIAGKRKRISALDLTSYLMLSPVTCGRCPSNRTSFDQCFMSAFDPVLMSSQRDFESLKNAVVSGIDMTSTKKQKTEKIERTDRDPIFSPPENTKKESEKQNNQSKMQEENANSLSEKVTGPKVIAPSNARRQLPMRGMGRGAKNLSALKARAAAAAKAASSSDLTKLSKPSATTTSERELVSSKPKAVQSNPPAKPSTRVETTAVANNQSAATSELQKASNSSIATTDKNQERPKEAAPVARRGGRGFGVKNLRAMMMKSKSNLDEKQEEKPKVKEGKTGAAATDANEMKSAEEKEPESANKSKEGKDGAATTDANGVNNAEGKESRTANETKEVKDGAAVIDANEVKNAEERESKTASEAKEVKDGAAVIDANEVKDAEEKEPKTANEAKEMEDGAAVIEANPVKNAQENKPVTANMVKADVMQPEAAKTDIDGVQIENTPASVESEKLDVETTKMAEVDKIESQKSEVVMSENENFEARVDAENSAVKSLDEKKPDIEKAKIEESGQNRDILSAQDNPLDTKAEDKEVVEMDDTREEEEKPVGVKESMEETQVTKAIVKEVGVNESMKGGEIEKVDSKMIDVENIEEKSINDKLTDEKVEAEDITLGIPLKTGIKNSDEKADVEMFDNDKPDEKPIKTKLTNSEKVNTEKVEEKSMNDEGNEKKVEGIPANSSPETVVKLSNENTEVEICDIEKSDNKSENETSIENRNQCQNVGQRLLQEDKVARMDANQSDKKADVEMADAEKSEEKATTKKAEVKEISQRSPEKNHTTKTDVEKGDKKDEVEKASVKMVDVGNSNQKSIDEKAKTEQLEEPEKEQPAEIPTRTPDAMIEKSSVAEAKSAEISVGDASGPKVSEKHTNAPTEKGTETEAVKIAEKDK